MEAQHIEHQLMAYVAKEFLKGDAVDLTVTTPLLELGVLDSFSILKLLAFADREFGVRVPLEDVTADDMQDISSIAAFVVERAGSAVVGRA
jgi:acyl carrier protein